MIADDDGLADAVCGINAARRIGQDDNRGAGRDSHANRVDHLSCGPTLVEVHASDQHQDSPPGNVDRSHPALVTGDRGWHEAREVGGGQLNRVGADPVRRILPTGAQDNGSVVMRHAGALG